MASKVDYVIKALSKGTYKKYETYIINLIIFKLNCYDLEFVTQQYVATNDGKKYIDLYFPQLKVAIEIDEEYHSNENQQYLDKKRMENIKIAVLESTITDNYHEIIQKRIAVYNENRLLTLEELDYKISKLVEEILEIKKDFEEKNGKLEWLFDSETKVKEIIKRGFLQKGDSFTSMIEILKVFGKNVDGWQRCTYKDKRLNVLIWSPTLSFDGSDRGGWINVISDDLKTIYESGRNGKCKTPEDAKRDIELVSRRVVFVKYKDALRNHNRRFLGVFECTGYDYSRNAEIWTLVADKLDLNIEDLHKLVQ